MEKYALTFGMESRRCIKKNITLLKMTKLTPQLVRKFEFLLDGELEREGLKSCNFWFVKQMNFWGSVFVRDIKSDF